MTGRPHALARDPGVQLERTALAWRRTSLSIAVGAAFLARMAVEAIGVAGLAAALLCAGLAVATAVTGARRYGGAVRRTPDAGRAAALAAAGVCSLGLVLVLISCAHLARTVL